MSALQKALILLQKRGKGATVSVRVKNADTEETLSARVSSAPKGLTDVSSQLAAIAANAEATLASAKSSLGPLEGRAGVKGHARSLAEAFAIDADANGAVLDSVFPDSADAVREAFGLPRRLADGSQGS